MNFRPVKSCGWLAVLALTPAIAFMVSLPMVAQESVLYSFTTPSSDGQQPNSGLISDGKGNFYGTTEYGGSVGAPYGFDGTVFELSPASGGGWTEKVLYSFGVVSGDGVQPLANLVFDAKGNLYGTTMSGGAYNDGTVFELLPGTGGVWTEKILHSFGAYAGDGNSPRRGSLIFDSKGNLYGTTFNGGSNGAAPGGGAVFELSPGTGGAWTEKVIYSLGANSADAMHASGGLVFSPAGDLYGVTVQGGAYNYGSVYELLPGSGGIWTEKVLHSFDVNGVDGASPIPCVILDAEGNLYGTTQQGGNYGNGNHLGAVYELSPSPGGTWTEQILYNFIGGYPNSDGATPVAGLIFDAAGNLYGTTSGGGPGISSDGTVFELVRGAGGWTERQIYAFTAAAADGHFPYGGVIFDAAGNLYGTTPSGGANSAGQYGTVFKIAGVATASPKFSPVGGA
ncbi:MAG TPA: choice-of-anchor tandem repeat GloVer-containing protein, partial [Terracidiphilus sp.]